MNALLLMVATGAVVFAAAVWITPPAAMWLAGYLIARATALDAARQAYRAQFEELRPRRKRTLLEVEAPAPRDLEYVAYPTEAESHG